MPPCRGVGDATKLPVNIVVLGASSVGKTTLTLQFITGAKVESESCQPTIETSFFKELKLNDDDSEESNNRILTNHQEGVECLWKMKNLTGMRKSSSTDDRRSSESKIKHKFNNNNPSLVDIEALLKITDTASYKAAYNPRKSLRERLAQKFAPRRRTPVCPGDGPVRKRYLHVSEDSHKKMSPVPSFIYRQPDGKSGIHESLINVADAFILVYSMRDRKSFEIIPKIRNEIHAARGCSCGLEENLTAKRHQTVNGDRKGSSGTKRSRTSNSCTCKVFPYSIVVVGTHMDLNTISGAASPRGTRKGNGDVTTKKLDFNTFSPMRLRKRMPIHRQVSLAAELMVQTVKTSVPEVTAEHVKGVIGTWPECVGYAEIGNDSVRRVRRVIEHLALEVIRNRIYGPKRTSLSSPRKRIDSVMSVFSRKGENEDGSNKTTCCFGSIF